VDLVALAEGSLDLVADSAVVALAEMPEGCLAADSASFSTIAGGSLTANRVNFSALAGEDLAADSTDFAELAGTNLAADSATFATIAGGSLTADRVNLSALAGGSLDLAADSAVVALAEMSEGCLAADSANLATLAGVDLTADSVVFAKLAGENLAADSTDFAELAGTALAADSFDRTALVGGDLDLTVTSAASAALAAADLDLVADSAVTAFAETSGGDRVADSACSTALAGGDHDLAADSANLAALAEVAGGDLAADSAYASTLAEEDHAADSPDLVALAGGDLDLTVTSAASTALAAGDLDLVADSAVVALAETSGGDRAADSARSAALAGGDYDLAADSANLAALAGGVSGLAADSANLTTIARGAPTADSVDFAAPAGSDLDLVADSAVLALADVSGGDLAADSAYFAPLAAENLDFAANSVVFVTLAGGDMDLASGSATRAAYCLGFATLAEEDLTADSTDHAALAENSLVADSVVVMLAEAAGGDLVADSAYLTAIAENPKNGLAAGSAVVALAEASANDLTEDSANAASGAPRWLEPGDCFYAPVRADAEMLRMVAGDDVVGRTSLTRTPQAMTGALTMGRVVAAAKEAGSALVVNRTKSGGLFSCELVTRFLCHPALEWTCCVGVQRNVGREIPVTEFLRVAAYGEEGYATLMRRRAPTQEATVALLRSESALEFLHGNDSVLLPCALLLAAVCAVVYEHATMDDDYDDNSIRNFSMLIVVTMLPLAFLERKILACADPVSLISKFSSHVLLLHTCFLAARVHTVYLSSGFFSSGMCCPIAGLGAACILLFMYFGFRLNHAALYGPRESLVVAGVALAAAVVTEGLDEYRRSSYRRRGLLDFVRGAGDTGALRVELLAFVPAVWMVCRAGNTVGTSTQLMDVVDTRRRATASFAFLLGFSFTEDVLAADGANLAASAGSDLVFVVDGAIMALAEVPGGDLAAGSAYFEALAGGDLGLAVGCAASAALAARDLDSVADSAVMALLEASGGEHAADGAVFVAPPGWVLAPAQDARKRLCDAASRCVYTELRIVGPGAESEDGVLAVGPCLVKGELVYVQGQATCHGAPSKNVHYWKRVEAEDIPFLTCAQVALHGNHPERCPHPRDGGVAGTVAAAPGHSQLEAESLEPDLSGLEVESTADVRSTPVRADTEVPCEGDGGLPRLYLGSMTCAWNQASTAVDDAVAATMVGRYLAAGEVEVDTARLHSGGAAEPMLGRALRTVGPPTGGYRLSTKVHPSQPGGLSDAGIRAQLPASLGALGVNRVDALHLYQPITECDLAESLKRVHELGKKGKVGALGLSNCGAVETARCRELCLEHGWTTPGFYQGLYIPLNRFVEDELLPMLREYRVSFIGFNPWAAGMLSGKHRPGGEALPGRFRETPNYLPRVYTNANSAAVGAIRQASEAQDLAMVLAAYAWLLRHSAWDATKGDGVELVHTPGARNVADVLTEPLSEPQFRAMREWLGPAGAAMSCVPARVPGSGWRGRVVGLTHPVLAPLNGWSLSNHSRVAGARKILSMRAAYEPCSPMRCARVSWRAFEMVVPV